MRDLWSYSSCFVGCSAQDLFKTVRSILVLLLPSFFSTHFVSTHVVHPYISIDTATAWKKSRIISSDRSEFYMIDNLSSIPCFSKRMMTSLSVDEILLSRYMNWSTNFRDLPFKVERISCLNSVNSFCVVNASNCLTQDIQ